ncbi:hypothetical protein [Tistrella mobilis]|uniref:hypothetical protein n=1 Tax=Tistrella mobilis TaxID=171437 RepID=UPI0035582355
MNAISLQDLTDAAPHVLPHLAGAGLSAPDGLSGLAALGHFGVIPDGDIVSPPSTAEPMAGLVASFKRSTRQRYIDPAAEHGLKALADAVAGAGLSVDRMAAAPQRFGLLLATTAGPVETRKQYVSSYTQRGRQSVSATLFSSVGYNIVGSLLARSQGLRGPVLTFAARPGWLAALVAHARRLFTADRTDLIFVGRAEADGAMVLALSPETGTGAVLHDRPTGAALRPLVSGDDGHLAATLALYSWRGGAAPLEIGADRLSEIAP